jgi:hypothetical protein
MHCTSANHTPRRNCARADTSVGVMSRGAGAVGQCPQPHGRIRWIRPPIREIRSRLTSVSHRRALRRLPLRRRSSRTDGGAAGAHASRAQGRIVGAVATRPGRRSRQAQIPASRPSMNCRWVAILGSESGKFQVCVGMRLRAVSHRDSATSCQRTADRRSASSMSSRSVFTCCSSCSSAASTTPVRGRDSAPC